MGSGLLKTAVLGVCDLANKVTDMAVRTGCFEIAAVAGKDPDLLAKTTMKFKCEGFDDFRQMIVQTEPEVLIVTTASYVSDEFIRLALKQKCHVLKLIPPSLNFEQCAELVKLAGKNKVRFLCGNTGRFSASYKKLSEYVKKHGRDSFYLVKGFCNFAGSGARLDERWLSDPQMAGGGVLLHNCYGLIDQVIACFGLPQSVYAVTGSLAPDRQQRLSVTEDNAVVTMTFTDTLAGCVVAGRTFGPETERFEMHCREGYIISGRDGFEIFDTEGALLEEGPFKDEQDRALLGMLESFGRTLQGDEEAVFPEDEGAQMRNMALIESAYLSAKTSMPEEPARIMTIAESGTSTLWPS